MKKVLGIILGVLMCIGGVYCLINPALTFATIGVVFGITLVESAIGYFILWLAIKKRGGKSGLLIANAILSLIAGIILLTNPLTTLFVDNVILIVIAIYLIISGITTIVNAIKLKNALKEREKKNNLWIALLVTGILVVIAGIISIVNPQVLAISIGINMAINIFVTGASLIAASIAYKEEDNNN